MTDLEKLKSVFRKEKKTPHDYWDVFLLEQGDDKRIKRCFVIGCPNGKGAHLQCLFDANEALLEAKVFEANGYPCECEWCVPKKQKKRRK